MKIINIGYNHCHDVDFNINRPAGTNDYLFLILKSTAIFKIKNHEQVTSPNSFILFNKGAPQIYRANHESFSNDWFHFDMDNDDIILLNSLQIPFNKVLQIGDVNFLSQIIKSVSYENYSTNIYKTDSVELYLKLFFLKLSEQIHYGKDDNINSFYDKMSITRTKIYNMPYLNWNLEWFSHELTISKSYFQHMYKNIFGISVMSDVINSRVEYGKYLLSSTDFKVKNIAEKCGYISDIHFIRQFKAKTGMTPSGYRKFINNKSEPN